MTDGLTVTVEGDARLRATMHGAARDVSRMESAPQTAVKVARDAATRAPRLTGTLAGSIRASYHGGQIATVGSDVVYAGRTEYGWTKVHQAARPFLRPALAANAPAAVRETEQQAERALSKVKGA